MSRFVMFWGFLLWILSSCKAAERDGWSTEFRELKTMMLNLDTKMSSLENKFGNLNILDYAFKVNNLDRHLRSLDTQVSGLATQMDSIQQMLQTSCTGARQTQRTEQLKVTNNELMEKIEDYGQKSMVNHFELLQSAEKKDKQLNTITNISRSGFSKLYQKIDLVMSIEGQMTRLSQTMNGWTPRLTQIVEQLSDVTHEIENVRSKVEWNGSKISNSTGKCSGAASSQNQKSVSLQSTKLVLELANTSEVYANQLERNSEGIATVVEKLGQLRRVIRRNTKEETAIVLRTVHDDLQDVQDIIIPTIQFLFNDLQHLHNLLREELGKNSTEDKSANSELKRSDLTTLKDLIESKVKCAESSTSSKLFSNASNDLANRLHLIREGATQQDILDKLSYVRNAVSSVQNDLSRYCDRTVSTGLH